MRTYLNSPDWLWTVDSSFNDYRPWFASGLPTALAEFADWQVWGGGFVVQQVWQSLPPSNAGIRRVAITSVHCDSFAMRSVEAKYCFPFLVSGRVYGIDMSCWGIWEMELHRELSPVPGLINNTTSTLNGSFEMHLEPESWFDLSHLDFQTREVFTSSSQCTFHAVPFFTMRLGSVR